MKQESVKSFAVAWIPHVLRIGLGGLFILAAWPKINDPEAFAKMIYYYKLLPDAAINPLALMLPWTELVCGVFLIIAPRFRQGAATLIVAMLFMFTIAIAINLLLGRDISCGCFSVEENEDPVGWLKVAENIGLIVIGIICAVIAPRHPSLTRNQ